MPKTHSIGTSVQIVVKNRENDTIFGEVDLPVFCIDHMRMTSPESNLKTMIRHIEMRCPGLKIGAVFVQGIKRDGLRADEVEHGITLHVEKL
jgi:hypothetical protein